MFYRGDPLRTRRRHPSIRAQLVGLVLVCVLPVWISAGLVVDYAYVTKRTQTTLRMQDTVRALAQALDRDQASIIAALQAMTTSPAFARADLPAVYGQAQELLKFYPGSSIVLADQTGQMVLNTGLPLGTPLPKRNIPEQVQGVFTSPQPKVSGLFAGSITKRPLVSIDVPVLHAGKAVNDLAMTVPSNRFASVLLKQKMDPEWTATILDGEGMVVYRTKRNDEFVGKRANEGIRTAITEASEGVIEAINLDGTPVYDAFCHGELSTWTVVINVSREIVEAEARRWLIWAVGGGISLCFAGVFLALIIGRNLANSIRGLVQPAIALGQGEALTPSVSSIKETEEVRLALVQASGLLSQRLAERRQAQDILARESMRLQILLKTASDGIHVIDQNGRLVEASDNFCRMLGYSRDEIMGLNIVDWDAGFSPEELKIKFAELLRAQGVFETRHKRRDGTVFDVEVSSVGVVIEGERYLYSASRDISQRKALEADLKRTNAELEQFAYVASHDLRQPLRMVSSYLDILEKKLGAGLTDDLKPYFGFAINGAKKMDHLITGLLEYSRTGRSAEFTAVPLGDAVADAMVNLTVPIGESGAELSIAEDLPRVAGDPTELARLFQNLIGNAVKYRSPDRVPKVEIGWRQQTKNYLLWVKDNGMGIDPDSWERAFQIFQRLVPKDAYEGTGIGLAVCKKIVEHHGGRIWIESEVGAGSTFFMTFPVSLKTQASSDRASFLKV